MNEETTVEKKSIVPAKYTNKYKNGDNDALAVFIKEQCTGKDGFEYTAFFNLCRKNGVSDEKVSIYEAAVAEKKNGSQGRARMTLRNMLASTVRKNKKLVGLNDVEVDIDLPKLQVSGAAANSATQEPAEQGASADTY